MWKTIKPNFDQIRQNESSANLESSTTTASRDPTLQLQPRGACVREQESCELWVSALSRNCDGGTTLEKSRVWERIFWRLFFKEEPKQGDVKASDRLLLAAATWLSIPPPHPATAAKTKAFVWFFGHFLRPTVWQNFDDSNIVVRPTSEA